MKKIFAVLLIVAMSLGSVTTLADLPEKEFACKVQTYTLQIAAVLVQAHDMASARELAAVSPAVRIEDGAVEQAQMVMECIRFPGGQFAESDFQAFVENMPR